MIKNFVFDMGNVITEFNPANTVKAFADTPAKRELLLKTVFLSPEWEMLDLGNINYAEAAKVWKARQGGISSEIDELCLHWHEHKTLIPATNKLVLALKDRGYGIYLLSNVSEKFPLYMDKVPALRALDGYIVSFRHHLIKPDPAIYRLLFSTYNLNPATCFFVDDVAGNVEAGRRFNMKGFVFPKDVPGEAAVFRLISTLNDLGVDIQPGDLEAYQCERTF